MYKILARASQAQNCCCKACVKVNKTLTRQAARQVTTQSQPRKVSTAEAFTALYSSIFATAAVLDAKRKDDRRQTIDAQISEAQGTLAQLRRQNASALGADTPVDVAIDVASTASDPARVAYSICEHATNTPRSDIWEKYGGQMWDIFHAQNCQSSLHAIRHIDERRLKRRMLEDGGGLGSERELEDAERTVSRLVEQLLARADSYASKPISGVGDANPLRVAIERLMARGYPMFRFPGPTFLNRHVDKLGDHAWQALNRMVRDMNEVSRRTPDSACIIEHICYHLLTSPFAPSPHTYSTFIIQLQRTEHHHIARDLLLAHFDDFRKHNWETEVAALTLDRRAKHALFVRKNVATLLREPSKYLVGWQQMFEAMISAFIGLGHLQAAATILCQSLCAGYPVHARLMIQVIAWCIFKLDRRTAIMIIRDLVEQPLMREMLLGGGRTSQGVLIQQLHYLLDLTGLWQPLSKLSLQLKAYDLDPVLFREFRMDLAIRDVTRQLLQLQWALEKLGFVLERTCRLLKWINGPRCDPNTKKGRVRKIRARVDQLQKMANLLDYNMAARMPRAWLYALWKPMVADGKFAGTIWGPDDHREARQQLRTAGIAMEVLSASQTTVRLTVRTGKLRGVTEADVKEVLRSRSCEETPSTASGDIVGVVREDEHEQPLYSMAHGR